MASVNWQKTNRVKLAKMACHFDNEKRMKTNHSNTDINNKETPHNYYLGAENFDDVQKKLNDYINKIDLEHPPKKKQKEQNRASLVSMEFVCPREITEAGLSREFFEAADELLRGKYGDAYAGMSVHVDEIHEYLDPETKEMRLSCEHADAWVAADAEWVEKKKDKDTGKITKENRRGINGKNFETKKSLNELNKAFDDMCLERFGMSYNTGDEPRKKDVEELKQASYTALKKEVTRLQRTNIQLINDNTDLQEDLKEKTMEMDGIKIELQETQDELEQANNTLNILDEKCKSMHNEILLLTEQRDNLQSNIDAIFEENQIKQSDIDNLSDRFSMALDSAFTYGQKAGKEDYQGERLKSFKNDSISKCIKLIDEALERAKSYMSGLKERLAELFNHYNKQANAARRRSLGMVEVYTDRNGNVSEAGKQYVENYITKKLETNDADADWEPLRMEYRRLPEDKKKKYIADMRDNIIYAKEEHEALAREGAWIKADKFDMKINSIMKKFVHVKNPLQMVMEIQQRYVEEEFER